MNATEHLNIMKQMHIDGSCTNVAYISASVNIVNKIPINVSRQTGRSLNHRDVRTASRISACRQLNESFKLIRKPIHWFDKAFEQNRLKIINHS